MSELTDVAFLHFYQMANFWLPSSKSYTSKVCSLILVYSRYNNCLSCISSSSSAHTPSNPTTLYEGTPVNLTCTATIDPTIVNTAVTVSSMWIAPNGEQLTSSSNDRITIVDMLQSAPYTSVLMFDPADDMDTGDYQCNVTVAQDNNQTFILPSSANATTSLNISGYVQFQF